ncbi:MAG: hypothetical protein ACREBG_02815 [Pyrinomonadaceae bacterium]
MKESKAHKFSLALPLVVPALVTPLVFVDVRLPGWLGTLVAFIFASGIIGGVPYVVLVALLFWWGRGKSDAQFKRALLLSPILMLPLFFVFIVLFQVITVGFLDGAPEVAEVLQDLLLYVSFILGFGYSYVLLVLGTVFVLKRLGVVAPSPHLTSACS